MHKPRPARWFWTATLMAAACGMASAQTVSPQEAQPAPPPVAAPPVVAPPTPPVPAAAVPPEEAAPANATAAAAPPSSKPVKAAPAAPRRTLYTAAVIQVLDKVTAETVRFEAPLHKPIRYKGLIFLVNTCQSTAGEEPSASAHLEIDSQPPSLPGRPINPIRVVFRGWMFVDTPGPHPFEHPVYDAWLIACKTATPGA